MGASIHILGILKSAAGLIQLGALPLPHQLVFIIHSIILQTQRLLMEPAMPVQMPDILAVNTINILPTQELVELNKLQMNNLSETTQDTNPNLNIRSSKLIRSSMGTWARLLADATMTLQRKVLRVWNPWSTRFLLWKMIVVFILQIRVVAVNRIHLVLPWGSIVLQRQRVIIHRPSMLQVFQYLLYQRQGLRLRPQLLR